MPPPSYSRYQRDAILGHRQKRSPRDSRLSPGSLSALSDIVDWLRSSQFCSFVAIAFCSWNSEVVDR